MPRDRSPDSTLALLRDGYRFVSRRCDRYGTDVFQTRLLLRRTICMRGREAARLFYDQDRFQRHGAAPLRLQQTLLGKGGVQSLDGEAHAARKRLLISLLRPERIHALADRFEHEWRQRIELWADVDRVTLYDEVARMLCRAVFAWVGVPLAQSEVTRRTVEIHAMIEGGGQAGPAHWRARWTRNRAEQQLAELVEQVRRGRYRLPEGTPLREIAEHRDHTGRLLKPRAAAVCTLNLLRPTVAVDRFVTFAALALHEQPRWRQRLRDDPAMVGPFVHEVRRYYPLFPTAIARVRRPFDWHGYHFPRGRRTLLDLYGTDHDPRLWPDPERFDPERFAPERLRGQEIDAFSLIPQGGGDPYPGHRCPGEWATIELLERAVALLAGAMTYDVPEQDLRVNLGRMPTLPASGFVMTNVRAAPVRSSLPTG
ncbi:cytochrome P450 [Micromonospora sp. NPDC049559]|uniref:cytochrome P450 n=1 Tax=Micromonospora sp. NPDC049559 TaxID=3155923 RepID=UPI00341991C9